MSQLKVNTIRHTGASSDAITLASDGTATAKITNNLSNRNLIINGAMQVAQRGTSSTSDGYQVVDRWWWGKYNTDQLATTHSQVTDAPEGFKNSYKIDVTTAETSLDSNEWGPIRYRIEGQDVQHLKTGTSNAVKTTLSFYAKTASGNSGDTYSVCIVHGDISGNDRAQHRTFTPTSTWQRFTMSFVGQTAISIRNDTDYGLQVFFILAAGSDKVTSATTTWGTAGEKGVTGQDNFFDSTNNEFFVTGVQLEVGDTATDFEHLSYSDELLRCQRYYALLQDGYGHSGRGGSSGSVIRWTVTLPAPLRASPTIAKHTSFNVRAFEHDGYSDSSDTPTVLKFHENTPSIFLQQASHSVGDDRVIHAEFTETLSLTAEL